MTFDAVIIGAGLAGITVAENLQRSGLVCALFTAGDSLRKTSAEAFRAAGGRFFPGDRIISGTFSGDKLQYVRSKNLGDTEIHAGQFVLATGKFFAGGLSADMDMVRETIFGLDVEYDSDRASWFNRDFASEQPFLRFGVLTDAHGRPSINGVTVNNLYAAGEIIAGISSTAADEQIIGSALKAVREVMGNAE